MIIAMNPRLVATLSSNANRVGHTQINPWGESHLPC
jgi:hypothetical protein